jgi:2-amino-4-hydroxy-6-hydroxymethyldihydropteridine diphosphokinase
MPHCLISFGSNLGDRFHRIAMAAHTISQHPLVQEFTASRLFETPAIGGPSGQEPFLNGVALLKTDATARDILELLQQTENALGRKRAVRWDARSIDLDVVLYGDMQGSSKILAVPHPRYTARRFVLIPAAEIVGDWRDPRFGWSIEAQAAHLDAAVPSLALVGGSRELRESMCQELSAKFGIQTFTDPEAAIELTKIEPWVASFLPRLPERNDPAANDATVPRLIVNLQWTTPESRWPATHQIYSSVQDWPEYRLEVDAPEWAISELASAIDSMGCPLQPATPDGAWYQQIDETRKL